MQKIKKMNIITKLHQKFVIDKIKNTDWAKGTDGPLVVELDPTEACNLACPGCVSEELIRSVRKFSSERLLEIGKELKDLGVKALVLIGGGEPLAHPKIGEFINYLGENDIHIGITTNGVLINKHLDVIAKYAKWTRVSVDASSEEIFNKLRPSRSGRSMFNRVIDNMRLLAKHKRGKLGFSFLIRTEVEDPKLVSNIHEIYDAAVLARDIGCDYFEVKPSYQYKNNAIHTLVKHDPQKMQQARIEIDKLGDLVTENFEVIKAITLDASLAGAQEDQPKDYKMCPASELRTLITPSGVYVCPYWRGKDQYRVGNAITTDLKTIWNSQLRKEVQNFLDARIHCFFHCLRHESNMEVYRIMADIKAGKELSLVDEYDRFI